MFLSLRLQPFIRPRDNLFEVLLLTELSITYFSSILAGVGSSFFKDSYLDVVALLLNTITKLFLLVVVARHVLRRCKRKLYPGLEESHTMHHF